jgi:hypothetical protein
MVFSVADRPVTTSFGIAWQTTEAELNGLSGHLFACE